MAGTSSKKCNCKYIYEDGTAVSGSGSSADPYTYDRHRIRCMTENNGEVIVEIDDCLVMPKFVKKIQSEESGLIFEQDGKFYLDSALFDFDSYIFTGIDETGVYKFQYQERVGPHTIDATELVFSSRGASGDLVDIRLEATSGVPAQDNIFITDNIFHSPQLVGRETDFKYNISDDLIIHDKIGKLQLDPTGAFNLSTTRATHAKVSIAFDVICRGLDAGGSAWDKHIRFSINESVTDTDYGDAYWSLGSPEYINGSPSIRYNFIFLMYLPSTATSTGLTSRNFMLNITENTIRSTAAITNEDIRLENYSMNVLYE